MMLTRSRIAGRTARKRGIGWGAGFGPWLGACLLLLAGGAFQPATAAGGSYASAGTGTYAQSIWWLDLSSYSDLLASTTGDPISYTLPSGAGTLTMTVQRNLAQAAFQAVADPASGSAYGAFGNGAYNGITGNPALLTTAGTLTLGSLSMKDAAGNTRSFALYAADGENTQQGEYIYYGTTSIWSLVDTVTYYAAYNGGPATLSGLGSANATETGPSANDRSHNGSVVLGTANPTQVTAHLVGGGNEAVLFGVSLPNVTFNLVVAGRYNSADQFNAALGYTSPAANLKTVSTSGTATTATTGALSVIGTNSVTLSATMASGSSSPLTDYAGNIVCTNSGPGAAGYGGTSTVLPSGAGLSFAVTPQTGDNITCTLTITPIVQNLTGTVYSDANHDATLDNGEGGTGIAGLYVKLAPSSGGTCQSPATSAVAVNGSTGAYTLLAVPSGTYCLILSNNATLGSVTPYVPPGWLGTETPTDVRQLTTTGSATPAPVQNFGLYNGSSLSLTVFGDTGTGAGTANDGTQNGGEPGLAGITVTASVGGSAVASAATGGSGNAVLWLPATTSGTVTLAPTAPAGDLATGGSAGTTAGSYARPAVTFTYAAGNAYTGVAFGLIGANTLQATGTQSAAAGSVVFYPQTFTAASGGQVTLGTTAVASPAVGGWSETLYLDGACSGQYASGDPLISAAIVVTAGQRVCFLVKDFVPAGAPFNAQNKITVSASFVYSGSAAPANATLTDTDTTTVTNAGGVQLTKLVQNVTQSGGYGTSDSALPGNTLQYQITVGNQGSAALSTVVVNDATPAYTTFVSAACPGTLPAALTSCTISNQPAAGAAGAVQWSFAGTLAPGGQTTVTYQVTVSQ